MAKAAEPHASSVPSVDDEKKAWRHGPPLPEQWQEHLIEYLEKYGTYAKACRYANVSDETVRRARHADPAFDDRCRWARELHADTLEEKLESEATATGNPVGHIVRLKAIRPQQYVEKNLSITMNVSAELPGIDAAAILRAMLTDLSPTTLNHLESPPALGALPESTG